MNKKRSLCRFVSTVNKLLIRNAISLLFSLIVIMESPTLYASGDFDRMMEAIDINDVKTVKALINKKIDLNQSPDTRAAPTFLTHAAWKGRTQIVKLLISSGADVNVVNGDKMTPFLVATMFSCASTTMPQPVPKQKSTGQIANPASVNCIKQGGTLTILKHNDGGEYGVCIFEDNRQCEEWAMFRGDCPVGGIKITGYITPAAQYCAITGGKYQVTGNSNTDKEQGTCTFKNGKTCDVWDYYAGKCNSNIKAGNQHITTLCILCSSKDHKIACVRLLEACDIIFALVDGKCTSVAFEAGYAHAVNKPVILIAPRVHTPKLASRWYNVIVSFLIPRGLPRGSSFLKRVVRRPTPC